MSGSDDRRRPTRAKSEAALAEKVERLKRSDRPDNPALVEMNRRNREGWAALDRQFEEQVKNRPERLRRAVREYERDQPFSFPGKGLEHRVQDIVDDERTDQAARARHPHKKPTEPDAIDRVIIAGIKQGKTAPKIWGMLIEAAEQSDHLEMDATQATVWIVIDKNGKRGRSLSKRSIGPTVTKKRKIVLDQN